ncbi:alpha-galactosidase [Streptomyces sp. MC1]|uniref:TIM-barrel domain-containing protein n=1 Tax=Streptomyces sp. MC1 TaxID=295105 RepID=UPI0018CA16F7|nr:alpha-galactosidase [Streptomyces sp. MC1]MBG7697739.1 alpha-galactosidase [Streptomyces sp. MC1]
MTDTRSLAPASFWVPGRDHAPPQEPVLLGATAAACGLRLQATDTAQATERDAGVWEVSFRTGRAALELTVLIPAADAVTWWHPGSTAPHATIPPSWGDPADTTALAGIPIGALLVRQDRTGLVYALDAGSHRTSVRAGLVEESADFAVMVTVEDAPPGEEIRLLLDVSGRRFAEAVPDTGRWLQRDSVPAVAPGAEDAVLCTWYFAHQDVTAAAVLAQADRAAALGFGVVIVDDGWQTTSLARGYGSCGDWEAAAEKFPDPAGMIADLRARGLRTMWWVGTPFLGFSARARDAGLATRYEETELDTAVLDPRDEATRRHLVERIRDLVVKTGADGVKLDFLERFGTPVADDPSPHSPVAATVRLLAEITDAIGEAGPQPLIEFREPYVHPAVGRFATMLRVGDCPLSATQNRVGIIDLRMARPGTPIHSDPIMWAADDTAERVAHHLINALFGVPQVSVDLVRLDDAPSDALAFWLRVWRVYRQTLLHGELLPERPDLLYPLIAAHDGDRHVVARYAPQAVTLPKGPWREVLIANADDSAPLVVNDAFPMSIRLEIWDARGRRTHRSLAELASGPSVLPVPSGGLARLSHPDLDPGPEL